jgi:hypothetical protein
LYTLFLYFEVEIALSLAYEFVGFLFFWIVTYSSVYSAPEDKSSLLLKRCVCVMSDDGKIQIHISDILHVTPLSRNYSIQLSQLLSFPHTSLSTCE